MEITTVKLQREGYLLNDSIYVPNAIGNREYDAIQEWIALGNTPEPEFTPAELLVQTKRELTQAIQNHLDTTAQASGYDSIISASSYASVPGTFQAEGIAFTNWRTAVWDAAIIILAEVEAEIRAVPTVQELIAELPAYIAV